ncbi:branched-chain amino acid ABC transporter permease [Streptomyces sp. NPDC005529]|uniref:branched-chain amino acid ABC transporter permease n=1 Tax=unclassified Streptomyces TaxID=2593676 RepID=UPI0033B30698
MERIRAAAVTGLKFTAVRHCLTVLVSLSLVLALSSELSSYRCYQLAQLASMVCATAGLTSLAGLSGQISIGQGAFMAVGAYTTALLAAHVSWGLAAILLSSVLTAAVLGALVGLATARLRGLYLATLTLALAIGLPALVNVRGLTGILEGENGLLVPAAVAPSALGEGFPPSRWQAWIACLCAAVVLWFLANLGRSRYGLAMRAARVDETAAAISGIHIARVRFLAFVTAAACGGLGGGLLAWVTSLAAPGAFRLSLSFGLLAAAVLGGLGSLAGAIWGSLLLVVILAWTSSLSSDSGLPDKLAHNLPGAIYGLVLIVVMMAFPGGLRHGLQHLFVRITAVVRRRRPQAGPR